VPGAEDAITKQRLSLLSLTLESGGGPRR
jgi:hypothetical protein